MAQISVSELNSSFRQLDDIFSETDALALVSMIQDVERSIQEIAHEALFENEETDAERLMGLKESAKGLLRTASDRAYITHQILALITAANDFYKEVAPSMSKAIH